MAVATDHMHTDLYQPLVITATEGTAITLGGSTSVTRNGGTLTFSWKQISGPPLALGTATTSTLTVTPGTSGAYELQLTVTDSHGVSDVVNVWLTIGQTGEVVPVAVLAPVTAQKLTGTTPLSVTLDGSGSKGTAPLSYHWTQHGGVPAVVTQSAGTGTISLTQPGDYEFELRVSDGTVTSAPAVVTFTVTESGDSTLTSGTSTTSKSGGCVVGSGQQSTGAWSLFPLLAIAFVVARARARKSGRVIL